MPRLLTGATRVARCRRRLLVLTVAALVAGCALVPKDARILQAAVSADDPTRLELEVDSCNADVSTEVVESADEVVVTVTVRNDTRNDCADLVVVELDEPLADRALVDGARGEPVVVLTPG